MNDLTCLKNIPDELQVKINKYLEIRNDVCKDTINRVVEEFIFIVGDSSNNHLEWFYGNIACFLNEVDKLITDSDRLMRTSNKLALKLLKESFLLSCKTFIYAKKEMHDEQKKSFLYSQAVSTVLFQEKYQSILDTSKMFGGFLALFILNKFLQNIFSIQDQNLSSVMYVTGCVIGVAYYYRLACICEKKYQDYIELKSQSDDDLSNENSVKNEKKSNYCNNYGPEVGDNSMSLVK